MTGSKYGGMSRGAGSAEETRQEERSVAEEQRSQLGGRAGLQRARSKGDVVGYKSDGTPMLAGEEKALVSPGGGVASTAPADAVEEQAGIRFSSVTGGRPNTPASAGGAGGGKSGFSATISGEVGPPVPGDLVARQVAALRNQAAVGILDLQARSEAYGVQADYAGVLSDKATEEIIPMIKEANDIFDEAEAESHAIAELIDEASSTRVNPGQFFANVGGAGRFASAIAVGAGAMATAFGGGPNAALDIIQKAIDRNVRAQMANQIHSRAMISHQTNYVHTLRGLSKDKAAHADYLNMAYTAMAKSEIERARSRYLQASSRLAAEDVKNQLDLRLTQLEINRYTANRAKVQFKVNSMLKAAQAQKFLQGGGQMPAGSSIAGQGKKRVPTKQVELTPEQLQDPKGIANAVREQIQNSSATPEQAREMLDYALQRYGGDENVKREIEALVPEDMADMRTRQTVPIVIGKQNADFEVIDPNFNDLTPQQQNEAKAKVGQAYTMLKNSVDIFQLLSRVSQSSSKSAILRHLRTYGGERLVGPARDKAAVEALKELSGRSMLIEQALQETKQGRNAINTAAEMERIGLEAGNYVDWLEQLSDWLLESPEGKEVRQSRYRPAVELMEERAASVASYNGLRAIYEISGID